MNLYTDNTFAKLVQHDTVDLRAGSQRRCTGDLHETH